MPGLVVQSPGYIVYSDCTAGRIRLPGEAITIKNLTKLLLLTVLIFAGCGGDDDETVYECVLLQPNLETHRLRDFQFARYRFFDLGVIDGIDYIQPGDTLKALFMYQSAGILDPELPVAVAYPNSLEPASSPDSVTQRFRELDYGIDWEVLDEPDSGRFTLVFPRPLQNIATTTIAYYMEIRKANGSTLRFGSLDNLPFRLQIVKFANPQLTDPLWGAEWRNVYDLGRRDLNWRSLYVDIFKRPFGSETDHGSTSHENGVSYLRLMGLDNEPVWDGGSIGDGQIDRNPKLVWLKDGLLVFPSREPFADSELIEPTTTMYETDDLGQLVAESKYYLRITTSGFGRSVRLGHINLIEGSERVEIGGESQTRDVHYNIDYATGEIEFLTDDIAGSNGPVQICYEYEKW